MEPSDAPSSVPAVPERFSAVSEKLNAPKKISQFEKARQEAEYKRLKEEAEARAALRDFEDSFAEGDDAQDDDEGGGVFARAGPRRLSPPLPGPRGSRDVPPGPPSLKRKWELEHSNARHGLTDRPDRPPFGTQGPGSRDRDIRGQLGGFDDEDEGNLGVQRRRSPEPTVRKPTMLLQLLPPSTTESDIRAMLSDTLKVEDVDFLVNHSNIRTRSAIVATSASTPASEVDKVVSQMQSRYLGYGYYLKISRHVSAAGRLGNIDTSVLASINKQPFGATHVSSFDQDRSPQSSFNRMAPPGSFAGSGNVPPRRQDGLKVSVAVPTDLKLLKLIHQTVDRLVDHGLDFEALLMAQQEVQQGEKWAWLYDPTSKAGVYYRWALYRRLSGQDLTDPTDPQEHEVFTSGPPWIAPADKPKYQTVTNLEDLCEHSDYVSSDEDSGDEGGPSNSAVPAPTITLDDAAGASSFDVKPRYLGPYRRAQLTHLLARLPEGIATLRSGDVARVSHFVINNAGAGADEVVDLLVGNAEAPFRYGVRYADAPPSPDAAPRPPDRSNAQLIALYVISDVLLTSSTSGVRDAWKYRTLLEAALLGRAVLGRLGGLERELGWGRIKAEQWRRKVGLVLDLWASASVFVVDSMRALRAQFLEQPDGDARDQGGDDDDDDDAKGRWKPANAAKDPDGDTKAAAVDEIAALKARPAPLPPSATRETAAPVPHPAPPPQSSSPPKHRGRPTAADLFDAPDEPAPERPVPKFGFSLALGGGGGEGPEAAQRPVTIGFAAPVAGGAGERRRTGAGRDAGGAGGMFDSDSE